MCGLWAAARGMGSSMGPRSGSMSRASCSTAVQPRRDFRWRQRTPCRAGRYTEGPGSQDDLTVETSGCGVRFVIKGRFFVWLSHSPHRKQKERPASPTRAGVNARRALRDALAGLGFREKCRLERIANYGGTMRLKTDRVAQVFVLLAAMALLTMAAAGAAGQDIKIAYEKFVLPNGLTVIVHEDHKAPIVALNIWYHVGSKNEKPGKTGFAHLFEHLMFGGSENLKGRYIEAMERVGATDLNGTTNSDRTNYFEDVPTSALDYALFVESDRMGHFYNTINKETLDLQRGVVQNEKRQGDNQPYSISRYLITENTYPAGHGYSWTTISSMEDLNAASLADVQEWFKTYYGPSNATLVIAGDIDVKTAREKVQKYFGDIPAGPPVAHQTEWVAKMTGVHRQQAQDRVPVARVFNVWNVPEYGRADTDYLDLVSDVLAVGKDSRFYKRLVYDEQVATSVNCGINPNEIGGQCIIGASAKPGGSLAPINQDVQEELDKFLKDGPTAEEMERLKTADASDPFSRFEP